MSSTTGRHRRHPIVLIGLSACLVACLLLATIPLSIVAVQQRVIEPPRFAVRVGSVEIAAPCPARGFECSGPLPWYAIWRGDDQPDGSIIYRQIYFIYLKRAALIIPPAALHQPSTPAALAAKPPEQPE